MAAKAAVETRTKKKVKAKAASRKSKGRAVERRISTPRLRDSSAVHRAGRQASLARRAGSARVAPKSKPRTRVRLAARLQKLRAWLLEEQARLAAELQEIEHRTARVDESERANELSAYEDHPADLASETFEREKDLAIGESVEAMLQKVTTAVEKIERGSYGICDACGRPIKKARLNALPFATLCLECQDRLER